MITRKEALQTIHDFRITSIGELAHGYTVYQATANILINQLFDQFESQLSSNPLQITCDGCVSQKTEDEDDKACTYCKRSMNKAYDYYQPKDTK